jgi:hypothetical protein
MYRFGLDEFAVAKFLKQSKAELTKSGAQGAMSLPEEFTHRAVFLANLPPKCASIVKSWFKKNPIDGELADLQYSIDTLSKAGDNFEHGKESSKILWRTIFANYINAEKNSLVESFLMDKKEPKIPLTSKLTTKNILVEEKLIEKGGGKILSDVATESLEVKPQEKRSYGFSYIDCKKLDLTFKNEVEGRPVLGEVETVLDKGQFFIDIKGILIDSDLVEITESQAVNLYPERGSATGYSEKLSNITISQNLLAIWNVHDQANRKSARFMIDSCVNIVLEIFEIPHSSAEPDLVRLWLKESYVPSQGAFPVFELMDGIILKPPSLLRNFKSFDFSSPFLGYYSHEAIKWKGKKIVLKPFPACSFKYECITTETAVKRLFKFKSEVTGLPVITNKQLQELAFLVSKESTDKSFSNSYQSIANRISEIFTIKDYVNTAIEDILKLPEIQTRLDDEISRLKKEIADQLQSEQNEISRLKIEKKSLEQEIIKSSGQISQSIKKAFEGAAKNGEGILSQIAILRPFLSGHPSNLSSLSPNITIEFSKKNELTSFKNLSTVIELNSLRFGINKNLLTSFIVFGLTKGVVGVSGKNYKKLIEVVSNISSEGFYASISLSVDKFSFNDLLNIPAQSNYPIGEGLLLGNLLEEWQGQEFPLIIVLNGFNRVPAESIITELLDYGNSLKEIRNFVWMKQNGEVKRLNLKAPVIFVLNFVYGNSTFPIPKAYAAEIPLISDEFLGDLALEEDEQIHVKKSYLGRLFFSERLSLVDDINEVELLKLLNLNELEAVSFIKLILGVGRIAHNELQRNLDGAISLNLDALAADYWQYIFEKSRD